MRRFVHLEVAGGDDAEPLRFATALESAPGDVEWDEVALSRDEQTQVIVVISKPPLQEIARKVLLRLKESGKPAVVHFIGLARERPRDGNLFFADSLEESALYAVALARQEAPTPLELDPEETRPLVTRETVRMSADQRYLRGLSPGP